MLNIPDITIINTINTVLDAVRDDYNNSVTNGQESRSILSLLFKNLNLGTYNTYDNVRTLLITKPDDPKHIEAKLSYDHNSTMVVPAIYLSMSNENENSNSLNVGQGDNPEILFDNVAPDQDEYRNQFSRRFFTNYYIVVIGENKNQMLVLYSLLKAMMILCINHFSVSGIDNIKISGQDLKINIDIPDRVFSRAVVLTFSYEQSVPELFVHTVYDKLKLYWKMEGAETRQGPIEIP